jgi:signal transduction histidine kinase
VTEVLGTPAALLLRLVRIGSMQIEAPGAQSRASPAAIAGRLAVAGALAALMVALILANAPRLTPLASYSVDDGRGSAGVLEFQLSTAASAGAGEIALYVPASGGRTRLEVDDVEIANETKGALNGIGFNSRISFANLDAGNASGAVRLRLSTIEDHGRIGVGQVFVAPAPLAEAALAAQIAWAARNKIVSIGIGLAAAFLFTMRLGRRPKDAQAVPIVALSYIVVAQALAKHPDVGAAFGKYIDGAEYILSVFAAFAVAAIASSWRTPSSGKLRGVELALLAACTLSVLGPVESGLFAWIPVALAAPILAKGLYDAAASVAAPAQWATSLRFGAWLVASVFVVASLVRAAEPGRFAESLALASLQSLGAVPLLIAALASHAMSTIADRRESVTRLKTDYAEQAAALARANAALEDEARRRALLEERTRITRDMHDGIGGRLLSLLVRVRTGKLDIKDVENEVQGSLTDLRLIVDSLDTAGETLGEALAEFRARAARQLDAAGIRLDWNEAKGALDAVAFDPHATLNIFRILQEAIANVIRHAGATSVRVDIDCDAAAKTLSIVVADDGCGMAPDAGTKNGGKGLKYMDARARELKARLDVRKNHSAGCRVTLVLPLGDNPQDASGSSSRPS